MWVMTEHTSSGHPETLLGQQPGFGIAAHVVHSTMSKFGFLLLPKAHKLSILSQEVKNSQVRFLSGGL